MLNVLIENLISNDKVDKISDIVTHAEINYISNVATVSKNGFNNYKRFINQMTSKMKTENNEKQGTVWDKIKRLESK